MFTLDTSRGLRLILMGDALEEVEEGTSRTSYALFCLQKFLDYVLLLYKRSVWPPEVREG